MQSIINDFMTILQIQDIEYLGILCLLVIIFKLFTR